MYTSQDPKLYKTVSSVAFSPNSRFMFSGGYDQCVSIWETKYDGSQPTEIVSLKHKAEVEMMAVNSIGVLATATRKGIANAIKVMNIDEENPFGRPATESFSSDKAAARPDLSILPSALHFSPRYDNLLLAGFGANVRQDGRDQSGDICLWDINTSKQVNIWGSGKNVFDVSFHPRQRCFAVGCVAGQNVNRGTRSTVRLYDEQGMDDKFSMRMELECRALDMNDVAWCPGDDFLVAAGCTSGRAYVWDVRRPDQFLRELAHGSSLMPLDDDIDRELTDTGIRFLTWGDNATRLYTGSSDGVVKVWNVIRSEEETFVKDLITVDSGIMSGAFSPDRSRLLLGEVNGSINILEVGRDDFSIKDTKKMRFIPYQDNDDGDNGHDLTTSTSAATDSGISCANELLQTGQMVHVSMGGLPIRQSVQGPAYAGPFDFSVDAPFLREQTLEMQRKMSQTPTDQCSISHCQEGVFKVTSEEIGDSGKSADRIPDELRQQWKVIPSDLTLIPGKTHCSKCGRAARPSPSTEDSLTFCERCSFACFRCGTVNEVAPGTEKFACGECKRAWDIGVLGYDCVKESNSRVDLSRVPPLKQYSKDLFTSKLAKEASLEDNASFGDEMNALTDYYLSLTIDRPESPPL
ncbi:hypothetical protein N0V90_010871 [Kalmusia sp. IMI 367209]|nr:hypothetical protein N0V90_010871 [Kalmusia sp. IMI 367209]